MSMWMLLRDRHINFAIILLVRAIKGPLLVSVPTDLGLLVKSFLHTSAICDVTPVTSEP